MEIRSYIIAIQLHLIQTHTNIFNWFLEDDEVKSYRPKDGGWTVSEILEHISLTSHFLLKLIDKGSRKALKNINNLDIEEELNNYDFNLDKIDTIGVHKSFDWIRPEHMEPMGEKSEVEIKGVLVEQLRQCLNHLDALKKGEGVLYKTTMTVNDLGKLNVYEYIYFLSKHANRHIAQMVENKTEFEKMIKEG